MTKKLKNIKVNSKGLEESSLLPTNDIIFHCLFGTVGNENITKSFIQEVIQKKIKKIDLDKNLNLKRAHYDDKLGILDVRAKAADGTNYNIEMQNTSSETLPERILSYWSRLYTGDLKKGSTYDELSKTIVILIVNDTMEIFEEIEKYHTKWNIREESYKNVILTDHLEIHIIELPKYIEERQKNNTEKIWLNFIMDPNDKGVLDNMKGNKEIKEAKNKYEEIISDEEIRNMALRLEFAELDYNTGIKHAREDGIKEGFRSGEKIGEKRGEKRGENRAIENMVISMYENNIPFENIAKIAKISIDRVKEIINRKHEKN